MNTKFKLIIPLIIILMIINILPVFSTEVDTKLTSNTDSIDDSSSSSPHIDYEKSIDNSKTKVISIDSQTANNKSKTSSNKKDIKYKENYSKNNLSSTIYNYETKVEPKNVTYTEGTHLNVTVSEEYGEGVTHFPWYKPMYVYINGIDSTVIDYHQFNHSSSSFSFDLYELSNFLNEGTNTVIFHPSDSGVTETVGSNCKYNPLTLNFIKSDYTTSVNPTNINYNIGEDCNVTVNAVYSTLGDLKEGDTQWRYYLNDDTEGIPINIDALVKEFTFNLATISDQLNEGTNTITFHPNQNFLEKKGQLSTFNYKALIITVNSTINYDYETIVSPKTVDYIKDETYIITVTAKYDAIGEYFEEGLAKWKYYLNDDTNGVTLNVDALTKEFTFDLATISDQLNEGTNTITFHPNEGTLENPGYFKTFKYNPLTINVQGSTTYDYKTFVNPKTVEYNKGEDCNVTVNAVYSTLGDLKEGDTHWRYYLNDDTEGIPINIDALVKEFTFNLATISDQLNEGTNTITFHPNQTILQNEGLSIFNYNPLTITIKSPINYDYETIVSPETVDYTKGDNKIINITAIYSNDDAFDMNQYDAMYIYINDKEYNLNIITDATSSNQVHAGDKSFKLNLADINNYLTKKVNTISFHPNSETLSKTIPSGNYNFNILTVKILTSPGPEEYIYVSNDGNDDNQGDYENPVSSIARAIEIVKETGIPNIRILEGEYKECNIYLDVSCNIQGIGNVILNAEFLDRIFKIEGDNEITLSNLTLINGVAPTDGYAEDATHGEIQFYAAGGAIYIDSAYVEMENMTFIDNYAEHFGGAINIEAENFKISNSKFIHNLADIFGGAIDIEGDNAYIYNCTFISNDAANGGAIGSFAYNITISNSSFENNTAESGAAIYIDNMPNTYDGRKNIIQYNIFKNNSAVQQGGAINVENYGQIGANWEYTIIQNNEFINNFGYNGGAIAAYYGDTKSLNNIFINNTAGFGGAIASITMPSGILDGTIGKLYLKNNTIINCSASESGNEIYNLGYIDSKLNIIFCNGGIVKSNGEAVILNVTVKDDMGNPISGTPMNFTVNDKQTINLASDLIEGFGTVRFVPRENGTLVISGIYFKKWDMLNWHNVTNATLIITNAIPDYFGVIYVSSEIGDDDNLGTKDSPVKTVDHGFLLATRENGSMEMVIYPGTYKAYGYKLTKSFKMTGIGNPILDAQHQGNVFSIEGEKDNNFTFTGLTFINGVSNPSPSGFMRGGAIFIKGGNLYLENDTFKVNSAEDGGGAIYVNKGFSYKTGEDYPAHALIKNCYFENNYGKEGGAIGLYDCDVEVYNSIFNDNKASNGGAISMGGNIIGGIGNLTVINSSFNRNTASDTGGAILGDAYKTYTTRYFLLVKNSNFTENSAVYGGAICGGDANITYCIFIDNKANNEGGAVLLKDTESFVRYSIFSNNNANYGTQYCGNSTLIDNNFWGLNYVSVKELIDKNVIYINTTPNINWVNIKIIDTNKILLGNKTFTVKFVSNNGSNLEFNLPNYKVELSNKDPKNSINKNNLVIYRNSAEFNYFASAIITDTISIYNPNMYSDNLIYSFNLYVKESASELNDDSIKNNTNNTTNKTTNTNNKKTNESNSNSIKNNTNNTTNKTSNTNNKKISIIQYKNMVTSTFNKKIDGKNKRYFIIRLKNKLGNVLANKNIQIAINGKIYKYTTNSKGQVKMLIPFASKGTYYASVLFLGDNQYSPSFITAKIKVKPQKLKLKTNKKTYALNKKVKKLTATLKNSKGKAIKGKKVVFIVNKKKYIAKTNSKGIATVKVKLFKKKTYNFAVIFAGDQIYNKSIAKSKIRIT